MIINISLGEAETEIFWNLRREWKIGTEQVINRVLREHLQKENDRKEKIIKSIEECITEYKKTVEDIHKLISDYEKFRVNIEGQNYAIKQTIVNKYGSPMFRCSHCGKDVFGQDNYCRHCGRKF